VDRRSGRVVRYRADEGGSPNPWLVIAAQPGARRDRSVLATQGLSESKGRPATTASHAAPWVRGGPLLADELFSKDVRVPAVLREFAKHV
jgi:hypothetical protein